MSKNVYTKIKIVLPVMAAALLVLIIVTTAFGSVNVPLRQTLGIILKNLGFASIQIDSRLESIIFYIRLPRVIVAAIVGAALSVSGTVMQGMFRNPMADPGILGVSSGAGLGAVTAIALGITSKSMFFLPLFAAVGALIASFLIFMLSVRNGKVPVMNLILSGIAVSMFLSAVTTTILKFISGNQVKRFIFWSVGSLNDKTWESVEIIIFPVLICTVMLVLLAKELNVMLLGEEEAQSVGLNSSRMRKIMLILSSVSTAAAVSVSGTISFVGLIVPHILRLIVGPDHRILLPASAIGGAFFLLACDFVGIMMPREINVGIVTSLLGAPYFLYLLNKARSNAGNLR